MSLISKILGLRPKENTQEAFEVSLNDAEAQLDGARARLADLSRERGERLLDANPELLARTEKELTDARSEADRLEAMIPVLRRRIDDMARQKIFDESVAAIEEAQELGEAFKAWFRSRYPQLAAEMREGFVLEVRAARARDAAMKAIDKAVKAGHEAGKLPRPPADELWPGQVEAMYGVSAFVKLPPEKGPPGSNHASFWPAAAEHLT